MLSYLRICSHLLQRLNVRRFWGNFGTISTLIRKTMVLCTCRVTAVLAEFRGDYRVSFLV